MTSDNTNGVGGIVLVGTHPWRQSAFDRLPLRPLVPIAHRPLISYSLEWLAGAGVRSAVICANRETQSLEIGLQRHVPFGMSTVYQEDRMPRGAAGAVRDAMSLSDAGLFVVAEGTAIPNVDLRKLLQAHNESGAVATVVSTSGPRDGVRVPIGIYVFSREALDAVPLRGFHDIKENLLPQLYRSGKRVFSYTTASANPRVMSASSYLAANEWMIDQLASSDGMLEGYRRIGESLIHRDASVAADAVLIGPVIVAAGARILSNAVVAGPTSIGCDAIIGRSVLVSRSAIWRRSNVGERAVADRCIVADDSIVAARTHAFRRVLAASTRPGVESASTVSILREPVSIELLRRMSRVIGVSSWSRPSAAQ
jgi:NDP-sugar pyrophosphorylase family protein